MSTPLQTKQTNYLDEDGLMDKNAFFLFYRDLLVATGMCRSRQQATDYAMAAYQGRQKRYEIVFDDYMREIRQRASEPTNMRRMKFKDFWKLDQHLMDLVPSEAQDAARTHEFLKTWKPSFADRRQSRTSLTSSGSYQSNVSNSSNSSSASNGRRKSRRKFPRTPRNPDRANSSSSLHGLDHDSSADSLSAMSGKQTKQSRSRRSLDKRRTAPARSFRKPPVSGILLDEDEANALDHMVDDFKDNDVSVLNKRNDSQLVAEDLKEESADTSNDSNPPTGGGYRPGSDRNLAASMLPASASADSTDSSYSTAAAAATGGTGTDLDSARSNGSVASSDKADTDLPANIDDVSGAGNSLHRRFSSEMLYDDPAAVRDINPYEEEDDDEP
jgi:hypothetical protein